MPRKKKSKNKKLNIGDLVETHQKIERVLDNSEEEAIVLLGMIIEQGPFCPNYWQVLYPDGIRRWVAHGHIIKIA